MQSQNALKSHKPKCPDCSMCQHCAESRCRRCRPADAKAKKLSIREQLELYDSLNPKSTVCVCGIDGEIGAEE